MKKILIASIIIASALFAYPAKAEVFTRNLYPGTQNDSDVKQLQEFLTAQGLYSGLITGNFFSLTQQAVRLFQEKEGIAPLNGYFGPLTRSRVNGLNGAIPNSSNPQPLAGTTPAPQNVPVITRTPGQIKTYEGVITQVNAGDNTFVIRLRDESLLTVKNPVESQSFLKITGIIDPITGILGTLSQLAVKDSTGPDAIPVIMRIDPGTGPVGSRVTVTGTGFTKTGNAITINNIKNAVTDIASSDGKTLSFMFPPAPCSVGTPKQNCPQSVTPTGDYRITLSNANGVSNAASFLITPLPPLTITTELLPQITAGVLYNAPIAGIGGTETYIWRISEGTLPPGIQFSQLPCIEIPCKSNARFYGAPTTPGTYTLTTTLSSGQETISRQFSIVVIQPLNKPY